MTSNKCYCLIPHPARAAFMLVKQGESWVLPTLHYSGEWTAKKYDEINQQILANYGLVTTVLRRLQRGSDFLICELEVHSRNPDTFFEAQWYDLENHKNSGGLGAEADATLEKWFEDADSEDKPASRSEMFCYRFQ